MVNDFLLARKARNMVDAANEDYQNSQTSDWIAGSLQ